MEFAGTVRQAIDDIMDALRRAAAAGPEAAELLRQPAQEAVAALMAADPYLLAAALAEEHSRLSERLASWGERDHAWREQMRAAVAEIALMQAFIQDVLATVAIAHRERTGEATLALMNGSRVSTIKSKAASAKIEDAQVFMDALDGEQLANLTEPQPPKLITDKAKAYALGVLAETGEVVPGVLIQRAGRVTAHVTHAMGSQFAPAFFAALEEDER